MRVLKECAFGSLVKVQESPYVQKDNPFRVSLMIADLVMFQIKSYEKFQ